MTLVDAPVHTENLQAIQDTPAILFGGLQSALQSMRSLPEAICRKIIYCGDAGNGHATRLVVAAIAAYRDYIRMCCYGKLETA